jgi:formate hydrogenlyase subunit 5
MVEQLSGTINLWLNKICQEYFSNQNSKDNYLSLSEEDFKQLIPLMPELDIILIDLFCVENFNEISGFTLLYVFEKRGSRNLVILVRNLVSTESYSIAEYFPSACWFEREVQDGFGVEFPGAFDKRRLFLHEVYPRSFHPLLKSFKNQDITGLRKDLLPRENYLFKEVKGEGVYQVPVGPVHAGIIEPGHFRFSVIGETIANLEVRMFYKHRGIEKLAEEKVPADCVKIAETISGDETVANSTAFCLAVEKISEIKVPIRAEYLRIILLEMERIYSHLGDMAGMIVDVAFPNGATEFHVLREEILRYNEIVSGSRFLKGMLCIGGVKREIPSQTLMMIDNYLGPFKKRLNKAVNFVLHRDSVIDRLETTGIIKTELIAPLNISGPAARASGVNIDTRIDHPYGIYSTLGIGSALESAGDVLARFNIKYFEILESVKIIEKSIEGIKSGPHNIEAKIKDGYALALVEAARGQNLHWVYIRNGRVDRYKIRTASFCNWQSIEHAVMGNIIPDFPLINKSLNLSYAGTDL